MMIMMMIMIMIMMMMVMMMMTMMIMSEYNDGFRCDCLLYLQILGQQSVGRIAHATFSSQCKIGAAVSEAFFAFTEN